MFISGASIVMLTSTILTSCTDKRIDKYEFDPNMPFSLKYTRNIKIKGDRERIMVLTDLHFHGLPDEDMENADKQTITNEFNDYRPDLILVLGDSIDDHSNPDGFLPDRWYENQTNFIHFMDTFKTP
jgi:hypothetical protein